MKVSIETDDIHAETVVIRCSKAEYAAMKYYAEYYSDAATSSTRTSLFAAAARFPGNSNIFDISKEFQDKLFR